MHLLARPALTHEGRFALSQGCIRLAVDCWQSCSSLQCAWISEGSWQQRSPAQSCLQRMPRIGRAGRWWTRPPHHPQIDGHFWRGVETSLVPLHQAGRGATVEVGSRPDQVCVWERHEPEQGATQQPHRGRAVLHRSFVKRHATRPWSSSSGTAAWRLARSLATQSDEWLASRTVVVEVPAAGDMAARELRLLWAVRGDELTESNLE